MISSKWASVASFLCALAVILGAFGAHVLKNSLSPTKLVSFETAVRYQMFHGMKMRRHLYVILIKEMKLQQ